MARRSSRHASRTRPAAGSLSRRAGVRPGRFAWRALAYGLGALAAAVLVLQFWFFAHIVYWNTFNPSSTAFMERRLHALRAKDADARLKWQWMPYERISVHLKRAVVAAEDARFLEHEGFDWEAIQQAMATNERRGRIVAGASTISQQLAKNLFLSGKRSWLRKAQEASITWMLERTLTKRRILELYLNVAEWGEGVFGAEAAARHHFGVAAAALAPEQAAWLAAVLPSPRRYERGRSTPYIAGRSASILARMGSARIP
jgi:monofunctional glycosyltransferase